MTSDASCHNFQTILKICTANFQIMEKPKKRCIIRTYTQGSAPAVQEINKNIPAITGNILTETIFKFWQQFKYFVGADFPGRYFFGIDHYMRPVPFVPSFARIFIYGSHREPSNVFQRFQRFERIGAGSSNALSALNARLKPPIPRLNAVFRRKISDSQH